MADLSKLAINQITNDPVETAELMNLYSELGVPAISPWRSKFEEHNISASGFNKLVGIPGISVQFFEPVCIHFWFIYAF